MSPTVRIALTVRIGLLAGAASLVGAGPAPAVQVDVGSFDSVSVPAGGVPAVLWGGGATALGDGAGVFTEPHVLSPVAGTGPVNAALAPAGDRSLVAAEPLASSGAAIRSHGVYLGAMDDSGAARLRRVLDGGDSPRSLFLAGSTAGDALLVWQHGEEAAADRRSPGGRLRPPVIAGRFYVQDAAVDGQGNATLIGYRDPSALLVTSAPRDGRFSAPDALAAPAAVSARVAAGRNGQAAVATVSSADGVRLYYRRRPDAEFGPAEQIAGSGAQRVVAVVIGDDGRVLVAWTDIGEHRNQRLRAMVTDPAGRPTDPVWLSSADRDVWYGHAAAAMNGAGDAAAVWEEVTEPTATTPVGPPEIRASFRPAGGPVGPPRQVTAPGRHSASVAPPVVAIGDDPAATVVWADAREAGADVRFMAARLTSAGLNDEVRLDSAPPVAGPAATSPPLRRARLRLPAARRVGTAGTLRLRVRCISWTLDPCEGRIRIVTRAGHHPVAGRAVRLEPNSVHRVKLRLRRRARRALAQGRRLHTTTSIALTGPDSAGSHGQLTLEAR